MILIKGDQSIPFLLEECPLTTYYAQLILNGVIAGSVYALFAVGLTMVYGVFRFINFAHGESNANCCCIES